MKTWVLIGLLVLGIYGEFARINDLKRSVVHGEVKMCCDKGILGVDENRVHKCACYRGYDGEGCSTSLRRQSITYFLWFFFTPFGFDHIYLGYYSIGFSFCFLTSYILCIACVWLCLCTSCCIGCNPALPMKGSFIVTVLFALLCMLTLFLLTSTSSGTALTYTNDHAGYPIYDDLSLQLVTFPPSFTPVNGTCL